MIVISSLLGELDIEEQDIIYFAEGIPAFEEYKQYIIIPMDEQSPFYYLQSLQEPDLCLVIARPFVFFPDYEIEIDDEELQKIGIQGDDGAFAIYVVLTIPEDFRLTTANLLAPLVVNHEKRQAIQYVTINAKYSTRHLIFSRGKTAAVAGEGY